MKKLILSLLIVSLLSTIVYCQNPVFDKAFDKYALKDGFTTVNVSSKLLNMFLPKDEKIEEVKIGNIKILSVEDESLNEDLNFYEEIIPKLDMNDYVKLLNIQDEDDQVVIMRKKHNKGKQEFLLIVGGSDNTMIYIEGDLNFSEVSKISDVLNSEDLSKISSSK